MRAVIPLILIFLFTLSCASGPAKRSKRVSKIPRQESAKGQPVQPGQNFSGHESEGRTTGKILLPTIVHDRDRSTMALVDPEQSLANLLDTRRGTLRPTPSRSGLDPVAAFYMDLTEISVTQYKLFDPKYDEKPFTDNRDCPTCPAMGIDWNSARKYCLWAGKRLPTEAEWEMAARGNSDQLLPWGNKLSPSRANLLGEMDGYPLAAPAASFPAGASPYGILDMGGNVWEWVAETGSLLSAKNDPDSANAPRTAKGGGWTSGEKDAAIANRNIVPPDMKNPTFGFRCVKPAS